MPKLEGKVAVITGASSGIGEAMAEALVAEGATVVVAARREDRLDELDHRINNNGGKALSVECDVTDEDQAHGLIRQAKDEFGRVDILVNNAVPEGVRVSLAKAAARLRRTNELLDPDNVEKKYVEVSGKLEKQWNKKWKDLCIGRDVLQAYHQNHVKRYLGYEMFRNRVARKIQETNRVPQSVRKVMNSVTAGL